MSSAQFVFQPGDRVPNFTLPDATGSNTMFYAWVEGRPVALLAAGGPGVAAAPLAAFAAQADALKAVGLDVLAVVRGRVADLAGLPGIGVAGITVLADPDGPVSSGLGAGPETARLLLLDGNQRVLKRLDGLPPQEQAIAALDCIRREPKPPPAALVRGAAPVLMVPRVLDAGTCDGLIARWQGQHEEGHALGVANGKAFAVYGGKKHTRDHYINDNATFNLVSGAIVQRVGPELNKAFGFDGQFRFDSHTILCYSADRPDRFDSHRDNLLPNTAHRRFAISLNLNDDYDGGELRFPEYGSGLYRPARGEACVFSCSLLHAAGPVTRGQRFALISIIADTRPQ